MFKITKPTLTVAAVIAAAGLPSGASARLILDPPAVPAGSSQQLESHQHAAANTPGGRPSPAVQSHRVITFSAPRQEASSSQGFQWDDAGIGAAGIVVLLGAGSAAVITRRRTHQTRVN